MTNILENINTVREETIGKHYSAAVAELEEKVKAEPLKRNYFIYSGCVSKEVTDEISHRFNSTGVKATPVKGGFILSQWYIVAEPALPVSLVHPTLSTNTTEPVISSQ